MWINWDHVTAVRAPLLVLPLPFCVAPPLDVLELDAVALASTLPAVLSLSRSRLHGSDYGNEGKMEPGPKVAM